MEGNFLFPLIELNRDRRAIRVPLKIHIEREIDEKSCCLSKCARMREMRRVCGRTLSFTHWMRTTITVGMMNVGSGPAQVSHLVSGVVDSAVYVYV